MSEIDNTPERQERHYVVRDAAVLLGISTSMLKEALANGELEHRAWKGPTGKTTKRLIAESKLWGWFYARTRRIPKAV